MPPACTRVGSVLPVQKRGIPALAGGIPYGAAKESNLPTAGLRRPAGFEDPLLLAGLQGRSWAGMREGTKRKGDAMNTEECYSCGRRGIRGFRVIDADPGRHPRMALCVGKKACHKRAEALVPPQVRAAHIRALEMMA
jgi:hypothetical protein